MVLENGVDAEIAASLSRFQGTVFPQGSVHFQVNPTCAPAAFVAALNQEDPGTNQIAQAFFALNGEVVQASLGWSEAFAGQDIEAIRKRIPASLAARVDSCLKRCNLVKH